MSQIKDLGTEKTIPDDSDLIPIQQTDGATRRITKANLLSGIAGAGSNLPFIQLTHTLASGVNGGNANFGSWTDRPINLIDTDETGSVTLSSNTFVLPSGIYCMEAKSTFFSFADAKLRLFNKTSNTSLIQGLNAWVNRDGVVALPIFLSGKFTVAAGQQISLQYWAKTISVSSIYNYGGSVSDGSPEKYASIDLWKVG